ncbi:TetR family transcriptional regulator [Pseudoxanthomonas kalamensis DSM 18571]|uniref:TetR/AcrR family transcriptional regulator n=1 Tax=Pseudoxanthomonas kalamensis TaxID=289483 RepID=UPI001390AC67|nr:TetR/AcrR family transcriptional regulator [Pseudoxanthomonas kalamensis]KAF1711460.1 TetR family transcriptional regulator [Pseudoxanthomonas kalamensis DSM 18571]
MAYRRSLEMQKRLAGNRQRILLAARSLIAEGGFRNATITAVAAGAGLSTGAVYRYFPSKADLFVEVLTNAVERECGILREVIARPGNSMTHLQEAVESFARRALAGPQLAYAFIVEPVDPEIETVRLVCRRKFSKVFETVLKQGVASGEFPKQSVEVGAACLVGAFTEALVRPTALTKKPGSDAKLVDEIVHFCCRAVVCSGHSSRRSVRRKTKTVS